MTNKNIIQSLLILIAIFGLTQNASITVNKIEGVSYSILDLDYSGFLPISDTSSDQLFFTFYSAHQARQQQDVKNYPLIIVVGSPGSSAQYLNLAGMGPLTLQPDMTVKQNLNTITNYANVMFIDLLGNGFSFAANSSSLPTKYQDYGVHLTFAINAFAKQSALGQSKIVVLAGQGTFLRALPGLDDIDRLSGIVHLSAWPELYVVGKYYGVAGIDLKIFGDSERIAIQSTFVSCYNYIRSQKYTQAHSCYDSVLNFVESKTKNVNVFNVKLGSNFTQHLPMVQYYFSQSSIISKFKTPTNRLFDTQTNWVANKTYADFAVNKTTNISKYMKDYLSVKHFFISGEKDYIAYKQSLKYWLDFELAFVESSTYSKLKLQEISYNDQVVGYGKQVKQVKYVELLNSGHYGFNDQTQVINSLLKDWVKALTISKSNHITEEQSQQQILVQ